uniref:Uncharacterized protein n=1 Tax=Hordeum vulgare subsp. vulgare TaxID=112509 RepID=A0A8I6XX12_HORVV
MRPIIMRLHYDDYVFVHSLHDVHNPYGAHNMTTLVELLSGFLKMVIPLLHCLASKIVLLSCSNDLCALWQLHKKMPVQNMIAAASLWSIWRLRNDFCFQGRSWRGLGCVLVKLRSFLRQWAALCDATQEEVLRQFITKLDKFREELPRIAWPPNRELKL